jgi:hypothetical protein
MGTPKMPAFSMTSRMSRMSRTWRLWGVVPRYVTIADIRENSRPVS